MLFAIARQYKDNRSTVRNEICLDIASLLLRWSDLINIVAVTVQNIGASGNEYMLLNVLSMLPIEVKSKRVWIRILFESRCPSLKNNEKPRLRI